MLQLVKLPALWGIRNRQNNHAVWGISQYRKDPTKEPANPSTRLSIHEEPLTNVEERAQVLLLAFDPDRLPGVAVDVAAELAI